MILPKLPCSEEFILSLGVIDDDVCGLVGVNVHALSMSEFYNSLFVLVYTARIPFFLQILHFCLHEISQVEDHTVYVSLFCPH